MHWAFSKQREAMASMLREYRYAKRQAEKNVMDLFGETWHPLTDPLEDAYQRFKEDYEEGDVSLL